MENTRTKTTRNSLILLLTAAIWGMAFVSQSKGMDYMHPFTFNGVRSLIGAASILVYILISRKIAGDKAAPLDWKLNVKAGFLCGIFQRSPVPCSSSVLNTPVSVRRDLSQRYILFLSPCSVSF